VRDLQSGYDDLQVVWDVSLTVSEGEFVALVGPNGAGKSTTLRTIAGLIRAMAGEIDFVGQPIACMPAHEISKLGISFVAETLDLFPGMTVLENLLLGAYMVRDRRKIQDSLDRVLHLFPKLEGRKKQLAGTLSGGERRMLAIARGLMAAPKILLVDEPSLGLAPKLVLDVFRALEELHQAGVSILLVEQNVNKVLHITERCYVMEQGRIVLQGESLELLGNEHVRDVYLGMGEPAA